MSRERLAREVGAKLRPWIRKALMHADRICALRAAAQNDAILAAGRIHLEDGGGRGIHAGSGERLEKALHQALAIVLRIKEGGRDYQVAVLSVNS